MANYWNLREEKLLPLCSVRSQGTSSSSLTVRMGFCTLYSLTFSFPLSVFAHFLSPPFVTRLLKCVEGNVAAPEEPLSMLLVDFSTGMRSGVDILLVIFMMKYGYVSMSNDVIAF